MDDDLRSRALTAAKIQADQRAREADDYAGRAQKWETELLAAAETACEEALGVRVPFSMYKTYAPDGVETPERAACASVEGVGVTYRQYWRRGGQGPWLLCKGNTGTSLQPETRGDTSYMWRLSHDLTSLGAAIQAQIDDAQEKAEREAQQIAYQRERSPESICPRCDQLVRYQAIWGKPNGWGREKEIWEEHKKKLCPNRPWWRL